MINRILQPSIGYIRKYFLGGAPLYQNLMIYLFVLKMCLIRTVHPDACTAHSLHGVIKAGAIALYLFRKFTTFMHLLVASFHN